MIRMDRQNAILAVCALALGASLLGSVLLILKRGRTFVDLSTTFVPGELFPSVTGQSLDGGAVTLQIDRPTVVYVFSASCAWSHRNHASALAVLQRAQVAYTVVSISNDTDLDALASYVRREPLPGSVIVLPLASLDGHQARQFSPTPQLIVVQGDGRVQQAWVGALGGDRKAAVEGFFGLELPDLDLGEARETRGVDPAGSG